jgi:glycosyltransferase involved in cell wall biosynthesis
VLSVGQSVRNNSKAEEPHPKKVLLVIDNLEFGGGERVFLQLAAGLKDRFEIFVAATHGGEFEERLRELDIQFFSVNMGRRLSWRPVTQLRDIIQQNKIALVHSQGARADFFARVAGRIANVPHILCTLAMPVEGFDVGFLRKKIYRLADQISARYVERFIVVSDSLRTTLIEGRGIPSQRVVRIYNGIELNQYHPDLNETSLRNNWGIPPSAPLIGAIGRMVWQKGFEFLINAIPGIIRDIHDVRFLFVGDGPLKSDLERLVSQLGISHKVIFAGFRPDISRVLSAIDILVVPSLLEGFPIMTLEAMAMAKPIVATRIQGITEQISDGMDGILVPPKNSEALTNAVSKILLSKELASKLGITARKKVETFFPVEKMVGETEKVYLSVLKTN